MVTVSGCTHSTSMVWPGQQMLHVTTAFDIDGSSVPSFGGQGGGSSADPKVKAVAAIHERELDGAEAFRPVRAEHQTGRHGFPVR